MLNIGMHSNGEGYQARGGVIRNENGEFAYLNVTLKVKYEEIGIFGSVQEILDLCEQINQVQQEIMRCREESQSTYVPGPVGSA